MGTSRYHTSTVPLVLNTSTSYILPQFHVVFDDWFATVGSSEEDTPDFQSKEWLSMFGSSRFQYVLEDKDDFTANNPDQKTKEQLKRQDDIDLQQSTYAPSSPLSTYRMPPAQLERGNQQQFKSSQSATPSSLPSAAPFNSSAPSSLPTPTPTLSDTPSSLVPPDINPTPSYSPSDDPLIPPSSSPSHPSPKRQRKQHLHQRKQPTSQRKLRSSTTCPSRSSGPVEPLTYTHDKCSFTHSANLIHTKSHQEYCFLTCFLVAYYCD